MEFSKNGLKNGYELEYVSGNENGDTVFFFRNQIMNWPTSSINLGIGCPKPGKSFTLSNYFIFGEKLLLEEIRAVISKGMNSSTPKMKVKLIDLTDCVKQKYNMKLTLNVSGLAKKHFQDNYLYLLECFHDGKKFLPDSHLYL